MSSMFYLSLKKYDVPNSKKKELGIREPKKPVFRKIFFIVLSGILFTQCCYSKPKTSPAYTKTSKIEPKKVEKKPKIKIRELRSDNYSKKFFEFWMLFGLLS